MSKTILFNVLGNVRSLPDQNISQTGKLLYLPLLAAVGGRKENMEKIWLLTDGDGSDGSEWSVLSIHATKEGADLAKKKYDTEDHVRSDGSIYHYHSNDIEEWTLEA